MNVCSRLAFDLAAQGRLNEADALAAGGLAQAEALLSRTPLDSSLSHYVATAHLLRADMISPRPCNSPSERRLAQHELRRAVELCRGMLESDAQDEDARAMYGECLIHLARLSRNKRLKQRLGQQGMAIIGPRSEQNPDNADLALLKIRGLGLTDGASVLPLYEQLVVRFPERTDFRLAWIDALDEAGQHERSRQLAAELRNRFPMNADFVCRAQ